MIRIGAFAAIVAVFVFIAYRLGWLDYKHVWQHIQSMRQSRDGLAFAVLFVGIVTLFTTFGIPATPFMIASGALFGFVSGALIAWLGAMLGAIIGYLIARTVGRGAVSRAIERRPRVRDALVKTHDFHGMLGLRLLPILPLGVVSFVGGLARAPFAAYLAATAVGIVPTTLIFCYFADSIVAAGGDGKGSATRAVLIASALVVALMFAPRMLRSRSS